MTTDSGAGREAWGATDVGRRAHNEDAYYIGPARDLVVVADGVGGHHAGEVASQITCEVLAREVNAVGDLESAIRRANEEVAAAVTAGRGKSGMATTIVAAHFHSNHYQLAWVGDSRAYLWDGQLKLLTRDHSYVEALLEKGEITFEEARHHPRKNVIVQAIGLQDPDKLRVGTNQGELLPGQILMLCSDGLSDMVDSRDLAAILAGDKPLAERSAELVQTAVANGGRDNITVVLVGNAVAPATESDPDDSGGPELVWCYDPATGEYHGLPAPPPVAAARINSPPIRSRVAPKSPEVTQMMAMDKMADLRSPARSLSGPRRGLVITAVVVLALGVAATWFFVRP
ncbi:hypothetical protein CWI75_13435 [Kineobactrum sediminis]|uniref:PPM-type phosphatase domain-containing protein n=1 Tax=Kineobactrum sediminis TaxID=1905677 RepID=A0A2N5Y019_9GAMM|nr:PP2C family serine/threonine-protein phosphatase [Kineobactrum sediminis]PLW81752.1 hypothetical protein CWI75_13435 [Kineobactrum sediminis]